MLRIYSYSPAKSLMGKLLPGIALALWAGVASPVPVGPGQEVPVFLDPGGAGIGVLGGLISADFEGDVRIDAVSISGTDALKNLQVPGGFILLDNSLFVESTVPAGKRRIRARIGYERLGRAGVRKSGIDPNSLRLLSADLAGKRWLPAQQRILNKRRADIRFIRGLADLRLGHYGRDKNSDYVWAVTDLGGNQYFAIGGLAAVPLPAAWLLFLTASGALFFINRRRDRPLA